MPINFFNEDVDIILKDKRKRKAWLKQLAQEENHQISDLNYIFCSDEYLLTINVEYLNHDTYTDIISFDNSEEERIVEGDIYISIERIKENAKTFGISEEEEISRVISHGLFHLLGYKDKTEEESILMRSREEYAIKLFEKNKRST